MKITVLGCGTSHGVPRIGNYWGDCDPNNPKNRRRRVSVSVEQFEQRIIIDTTPDLRVQLLDAGIDCVDAVFYTHDHADHCHGIDDLRGLYHAMGSRQVPVYADVNTLETLSGRFNYVFEGAEGYPAIVDGRLLTVGTPVEIGPMRVMSFRQIHGAIGSVGYRIGNFAYSTDVSDFPEESYALLEGLDVWVVDALRRKPHPTHPHLDKTLAWIETFKPKRAYLTHMAWDMDYDTLCAELPAHIRPAYDGLTLEISDA